jgi:hypothetical protein
MSGLCRYGYLQILQISHRLRPRVYGDPQADTHQVRSGCRYIGMFATTSQTYVSTLLLTINIASILARYAGNRR